MNDEGHYAAWQAHQELDRMPDPSRNPCEHCENEIQELRAQIDKLMNEHSDELDGTTSGTWRVRLSQILYPGAVVAHRDDCGSREHLPVCRYEMCSKCTCDFVERRGGAE